MFKLVYPEPLTLRGDQVSRKDLDVLLKSYTVDFSPILAYRDLWPFTRVIIHWGKGNDKTCWGLLDTGSELMLIPGD